MDFYDVVHTLGRGTFGSVYLCERKHNKQKIVVKKIFVDLNGDGVRAARNEVSILKSLHHPNIIRYYDSFFKDAALYIVMEFANKGTLKEFLHRQKCSDLEPQKVMNLFGQILMGLHHIHSKRVIHRDLKCENIFLTGKNSEVVKIGDFGISKILLNNKDCNTIIGTCNYVAPELCNGKPYGIKTDIWALGCILYEMCTLEKLFDGNLTTVVIAITSGKQKKVNTEIYGVQMQYILDMLLQLEPENRPNTAFLMSLPDIYPSMHSLQLELSRIPYIQSDEEKIL